MLRYTILDIIINNNDNISQQTLECFIEAIVEDPKIDIIPVNAEPTTCSISIIVVCDTIIISTI